MRSRETTVADDIYYVDDYLSYHDQEKLVNYLRSLKWYYEPLASYGFQNPQGNMKDALLDDANGYFYNILYYVQAKMIKELPKEIMPLIDRLEPSYLGRVKCNLYVRSKANRAIFFNSAVPHRTTCPIHAKERVTININYQSH